MALELEQVTLFLLEENSLSHLHISRHVDQSHNIEFCSQSFTCLFKLLVLWQTVLLKLLRFDLLGTTPLTGAQLPAKVSESIQFGVVKVFTVRDHLVDTV